MWSCCRSGISYLIFDTDNEYNVDGAGYYVVRVGEIRNAFSIFIFIVNTSLNISISVWRNMTPCSKENIKIVWEETAVCLCINNFELENFYKNSQLLLDYTSDLVL